MEWKSMEDSNKAVANGIVERLYTDGYTNLWDGMRVALQQFQVTPRSTCMRSMFLLTDGEPSEHLSPPRGIVPVLQRELVIRAPPPLSLCFTYFTTNLVPNVLLSLSIRRR
jgi:hypothetical protein